MPKKTVEAIIDSGNNYVIHPDSYRVKGNQKTLFQEIQRTVKEQAPIDTFELREKGHGRHSFWQVSVFDATLSTKVNEWNNLKRFIHVHKEVFYTNPKTKKNQSSNERFYIASKAVNSAKYFHQGIREHWSIENQLHWVKDVIHSR